VPNSVTEVLFASKMERVEPVKKTKERAIVEFDPDVAPGLQPTIAQTEAALEAKLAQSRLDLKAFFGLRSEGRFVLGGADLDQGLYLGLTAPEDFPGSDSDFVGPIGPLFTVIGTGTGADGHDARVLEYRDAYRQVRRVVVPVSVVQQGGHHLASFLGQRGFAAPVAKKPRAALQSLLSLVPGPRIQIVSSTGWISRDAFVIPGKIIGDQGSGRVVADTDTFRNLRIAQRGSFEEWRDVLAAMTKGNSRLQFALSIALASPLLRFAPNVGPTVAHIFGDSSMGKSTVLELAGSAWGGAENDPLGFAHSWNATANFHISNAAAHSGTLLCLDEIHTAQDVVKTAYTLASGQGRGRLTKEAQQRSTDRYQTMVLSTGELTLDEMERQAAGAKRQTFAGAEIRLPSIPADAGKGLGIFDNIGKFTGKDRGAARFADALRTAARSNYGHAGPRFVECIIEEIKDVGEEAFRRDVARFIRDFAGRVELEDDADDAVKRLLRTFGLIAASGQLACRWEILPLEEDDIADGIATCFKAWIVSRGGARSKTSSTALIELRDFLQQNIGRFVPVDAEEPTKIISIAGYRETTKDGSSIFYILQPTWKHEIIAKAPRARLIEELDRLGLLKRQASTPECASIVKKIQGDALRVYAVRGEILELTDAGTIDGVHIAQPNDDRKIVPLSRHRAKAIVRQIRA
jgi:putative DNA primase/helicase